jgi:hypothetical protein
MPRGGAEVWFYSFFNLGTRWLWVVNATPRPLNPRETRYPSYRRLCGSRGGSGGGAEDLAPTGTRSPYRQTRSDSLYRLSSRGPLRHNKYVLIFWWCLELPVHVGVLRREFDNVSCKVGVLHDRTASVCFENVCRMCRCLVRGRKLLTEF